MNAKKLTAAIALLIAAGAASADSTYPYVDHSDFVATKTRAEVQAELHSAIAQNPVNRNIEYIEFTNSGSGKTRAEAHAELEKAYAEGQYASNSKPEFVEASNIASSRTRDEVRNDAIRAAKNRKPVNGVSSGG